MKSWNESLVSNIIENAIIIITDNLIRRYASILTDEIIRLVLRVHEVYGVPLLAKLHGPLYPRFEPSKCLHAGRIPMKILRECYERIVSCYMRASRFTESLLLKYHDKKL